METGEEEGIREGRRERRGEERGEEGDDGSLVEIGEMERGGRESLKGIKC